MSLCRLRDRVESGEAEARVYAEQWTGSDGHRSRANQMKCFENSLARWWATTEWKITM